MHSTPSNKLKPGDLIFLKKRFFTYGQIANKNKNELLSLQDYIIPGKTVILYLHVIKYEGFHKVLHQNLVKIVDLSRDEEWQPIRY